MSFQMKTTPQIEMLTSECVNHSTLDTSLYKKYDVKRGLRDLNGTGVLAGLTQISNIVAFKDVDGVKTPCDGELYYRGINIKKLTAGFLEEDRFGFEETAYLLLFGMLPNEDELKEFTKLLANQRALPKNFVRDVIMKAPSKNMMNTLSRSVLTLYYYDSNPDDISLSNVLRQCLNLIADFPMLSVYGYQAYNHYIRGRAFIFTIRPAPSPQRKIFSGCFARIKNSPTLRPRCWIWLWCSIWNTEAEITLRLPPMW